ncbi:MAG TPA: DUF2723 domain-containing protein [Roseiflexaceae bacterium]
MLRTSFLDRFIAGLILAALACAYAWTLAPGITWANDGADSGDLVTAAATLGVAHPTGYPTYLLLARLFQLLPVGDLAFRTNLLSAASAASAALCVYTIVRGLAPEGAWRTAVAAAAGALGLGLSPLFWSQAVVAEVYSLNALFAALLLLWTLQALRRDDRVDGRFIALRGVVAGLALGNHITIALPVAAWLVASTAHRPLWEWTKRALKCSIWVGLGLLVYAYLPLRAAAHPPVNWGGADTWAGFWWVVSGQPYRGLAFGLPAEYLSARVAAWAALLTQQFGWVGLGLGFLGLFYGAADSRRFVWLTAGMAVAYSAFAISYNTADSYAYLLPAYAIFAIWIGLGVHVGLAAIHRRRPPLAAAAAALLAVALAWRVSSVVGEVDASQDQRAIVFATRALAAAPRGAIVVTASDRDTFALWYYHYALSRRPDIVVVVEPLLAFDWYRENLRTVYPTLRLPARTDTNWIDAIMIANPTLGPICRTDTNRDDALACGASLAGVGRN